MHQGHTEDIGHSDCQNQDGCGHVTVGPRRGVKVHSPFPAPLVCLIFLSLFFCLSVSPSCSQTQAVYTNRLQHVTLTPLIRPQGAHLLAWPFPPAFVWLISAILPPFSGSSHFLWCCSDWPPSLRGTHSSGRIYGVDCRLLSIPGNIRTWKRAASGCPRAMGGEAHLDEPLLAQSRRSQVGELVLSSPSKETGLEERREVSFSCPRQGPLQPGFPLRGCVAKTKSDRPEGVAVRCPPTPPADRAPCPVLCCGPGFVPSFTSPGPQAVASGQQLWPSQLLTFSPACGLQRSLGVFWLNAPEDVSDCLPSSHLQP